MQQLHLECEKKGDIAATWIWNVFNCEVFLSKPHVSANLGFIKISFLVIPAVCQVYQTGDKLIKLEILARLIAKDTILLN